MVMSNKGGVGKSTIALNLACGLFERGKKVGLLDVDLHGPNLAKMLGIEKEQLTSEGEKILPFELKPGLKVVSLALVLGQPDAPVIWRGPMKMKAIQQFIKDVKWGELDYLIVDSPPGTGDEPLSVIQLISSIDGVVIVTTPQDVALLDSRKAVNFARELKVPVLGIVENMSGFTCPHCGQAIDLFKKGGGEKAAREMGVPFLGSVPLDPQIVSSGDSGNSFVLTNARSEAAQKMNAITSRIMQLEKGPAK